MALAVLLTAIITSSLIKVGCQKSDEPVLKLVHVFFRHGSRTPDKSETFPTDPLAVNDFRPLGYGQLTNIGKRRAHQLGKLLRARYANFLGDTYYPGMVLTKSTDYTRTQMSALLVLAGLFPPTGFQKWDNDLNWMPVPYTYEKKSTDYELRRPSKYCPKLNTEIETVIKSEHAQKMLKDHQDDLRYMSQHCGRNLQTFQDVFHLYQSLHAEERMNETLPAWTNRVYPGIIHYLAMNFLYFENSNEISKRLNGGRMLKKVIQNMVKKSQNLLKPPEAKIFLYSGHEANIVSILCVLDLFDMKIPDFSAATMIELYTSSKQYTVKVIYVRDVYKQPEELIIPGCTEFCPLEKLVEIVKQYLPNNYTEECGSLIPLD